MKKLFKITLLSLCVILCFSSCAFIEDAVNDALDEAERVTVFAEDLAELIEEPSIEKAELLIHPDSALTAESVIATIQNNEKLQNLDPEAEIQVGEITNLKMSHNDETLGGNVYTAECRVTVGDTVIDINLVLLSKDGTMGLYDFTIE